MVRILVEHRRDSGHTGEKEGEKRAGGEVGEVGLDRFQWNRRLGGAGGTWNGKRVEGEETDWRLGRTGSRLMAQKG
jgi:hypothetical protein